MKKRMFKHVREDVSDRNHMGLARFAHFAFASRDFETGWLMVGRNRGGRYFLCVCGK